jgi:tetratricopeptide (TPR) repeat protein
VARKTRPCIQGPLSMLRAILLLSSVIWFCPISVIADVKPGDGNNRLDRLHAELKSSKNQAEADTTVRKIWIEWLKSGKPAIDRMMADAIARVDRNELQGALGVLDQVVQQAPHYAEGWNSRATVLYLLGSFEKSVADIGRTLALEPRHFGAMAGLGKILLQRGKLKEALGVYRRALVVNPFMVERDSVIPALEREVEGRGI